MGIFPPVSDWDLRQRTGITYEQLQNFKAWGLICPTEDGPWSPESVARIQTLKSAAEHARTLPRRVLFLRATSPYMNVKAESLRRALLELLPSIRSPSKKMRRINALAVQLGQRNPVKNPMKAFPVPHRSEWLGIVRGTQDARLEASTQLACGLTHALMQLDLDEIPCEEVLALLTIRELVRPYPLLQQS